MKKIILFDLDGTLIDSTEAILESFRHALGQLEHPEIISDEAIKGLIGYPLDVMFSRLGCEEAKVDRYVQTYKEYYREISRQKTSLLPFARESIEEASVFARLGIVTTKTGHYSRDLMEHFGLMEYFEVLIGREHVDHPKPHPEPIHKALSTMGRRDEEVWMIGDTRLDIEASHRAGIESVAVTSGYDNAEQLSVLTDIIHSNSLEAVRYIVNRG